MSTSLERNQAEALTKLNLLAQRLVAEGSPVTRILLQKIAKSAKEVLKADLIELYEYWEDQKKFELPQISVGEKQKPSIKKVKIYDDDTVFKLIHRPKPLYKKNSAAEPSFSAPYAIARKDRPSERFIFREKIRSTAAIPLTTGNESVGLMFANYRTTQAFLKRQQDLIELFANQAAIAIKNARFFQQIHDQAAVLAELNELAYNLLSIEQFPEVRKLLEKIAQSAKVVLKADLIELYEYRQDRDKYELPPISIGKKDRAFQKTTIHQEDAVWQLIQRSAPLYVENAQDNNLFTASYIIKRGGLTKERFVFREKIESTAAIPLRTESESMGLMFASYRTPQKFTKERQELIELFAKQAAIAVKNSRLYYYVNQRREALTKLNQIAQHLVSIEESQNTRNLLKKIAESAKEVLRADLIELYEYSQDQNKYELPQIAVGETQGPSVPKNEIYADDAVFQIIKRPEPFYEENAQAKESIFMAPYIFQREDQPANRFVVREKILSTAAIPLRIGNESMGLMFANYRTPQKFTKEQQELIELFANQAAIAINNSRLYYDVNQRQQSLADVNRRQEALVEFGAQLSSKIRQGETPIFEFIHEQATQFMDTDNMYIAKYDSATDMVHFGLFFKNGQRGVVESRKAGKGRTEEIIRTGKFIFIATRKESDEWYKQPGRAEYIGDPLASWIGVPMRVGEKVIGAVATYHPTKDYVYNEDDVKILQSMADLAAIALENARLFAELEQALKKIAESEAVITRTSIAADFVHRLNNLAGTIPVWVDQIRDHLGSESLKDKKLGDYLDNIESNTDGLLRAAEKLKFSPEEQDIDIQFILESLVRQTRVQISANVRVHLMEFKEKLPVVRAVAAELTNAFWSIMENAIDAMPDGGTLTIEAKRIVDANDKEWVEIQITDTGKDVARADIDKIFLPFYSTKTGHIGYGLWRAQNIIERIGGNIRFQSEEGEGTTFFVKIPALKSN